MSEIADKLKESIDRLKPTMELLKQQMNNHKLIEKKGVLINNTKCEVSLIKSGLVLINFVELEQAEKFYKEL